MAIDLARLKAIPVSEVVRLHGIELRAHGPGELRALCPFHSERTPSFSVNDGKGLFFCFGCNAQGDGLDFHKRLTGLTEFRDAALDLGARLGLTLDDAAPTRTPSPLPARPAPAPVEAEDESDVILPVPDDAPAPSFKHARHGLAARTWTYRDATGRVNGYVCRFEPEPGRKEIVPRYYTAKGWKWTSAPKPRSLYNLDGLAAKPQANVIVVEGEKAADAAVALFPASVVVTWPGGSKAVKHADWTALAGRVVAIWPDRDRKTFPLSHEREGDLLPWDEQPGFRAAVAVADALTGIAAAVRIAVPPRDVTADGWDAADAVADGWDADRASTWLRASLVLPSELGAALSDPVSPDTAPPAFVMDEDMPPFDDDPPVDDDATPFQALGHDHGDYYYLARGARQVLRIPGASHGKGNLLMLAPLQYWEREYASKNGADWDAAANALIRLSEGKGVYDPDRVRGRGAWWDNGRPVLHLGDKLIADGKEHDVWDQRGRYIYEAAAPLRINVADPLTNAEAVQLVTLCRKLSWERPHHALLLAGWCVVAPISGALRWRPHIWMTGPAGSGKTWVYESILSRCLGNVALKAASETTEAGLRQALGTDARPVIFDEADGETAKAQARIQNVLALMRQASTETSAAIYKGTATGEAQAYQPRSCFAFSSIGVGLHQIADHSRVTVLTLIKPHGQRSDYRADQFAKLVEFWHQTLTDRYIERLHARTVSMIPVIRKNAETFAVAGSRVFGNRRFGDQLGALLAGAYALHSTAAITLADAEAWLHKQDWSDEVVVTEERDEVSCLRTISQHVIHVQYMDGNNPRRVERAIGELVAICVPGAESDKDVPPAVAKDVLMRIGLRYEPETAMVSVANTHKGIEKILRDTPWAKNWGRTLKRVDGAISGPATRFGSSPPDRTTLVPILPFVGES